jgi:hypothetical protein
MQPREEDRLARGAEHPSRSADFKRRSALYTRLDARLGNQTRFFAAAALINAAFAQLFQVWPAFSPARSLDFLNEAGAALEGYNRASAREIDRREINRVMAGPLDHALVHAEQRRLQRHVRAQQARCPRQWASIRGELNGLLNDRYAASFFSRWCEAGRGLSQVLREIRGASHRELDFADESHRVLIGLKLIGHVRAKGARR